MTSPKPDPLKPFVQHGVIFRGANQSQAYGDCPFTGKQNKFYVHKTKLLWDSKVTGQKGNVIQFLEYINEQNKEDISKKELERLAENRGLPRSAFSDFEIGKSSKGFTFPVRSEKGKLLDLRSYRLGKKVIGTSGCSTHLFNLEEMYRSPETYPVYLCEGEWDTIAMRYLLKRNKAKAVAVGVPGANVFKREWAKYFRGRDVIVCYDNDEAGEAGEMIVHDRLQACANSVSYLHWLLKFPTGYDLRDLISKSAVLKNKPIKTFKAIKAMLRGSPRKIYNNEEVPLPSTVSGEEEINLDLTLKDVTDEIGKWLYMKNFDAFYVALATVLSTYSPGDPSWIFLVGAPSGSKTEILQTFSKCRYTHFLSSLTPHSLVSGSSTMDGKDPSILPQLDMKTLITKDFTVVMSMRDTDRDAIFSILRDAYDGSTSKAFGKGFTRSYEVHFSFLAGVTPEIYALMSKQSSLGERFLKFNVGGALDHDYEEEIMLKSFENQDKSKEMREEMAMVVNAYVIAMVHRMKQKGFKLPEAPMELKKKLIKAVQYASYLRGSVSRHMRENELIVSKPFREMGARFGNQNLKLMRHLALVFGNKEVGDSEWRIGKKVILDTVDQRTEEIVRKIFINTPHVDDTLTASQIQGITGYNRMTVRRVLDDLTVLKVLDRQGKLNKYEYSISKKVRGYIEGSGIYEAQEQIERRRADLKAEVVEKRKVRVRRKR